MICPQPEKAKKAVQQSQLLQQLRERILTTNIVGLDMETLGVDPRKGYIRLVQVALSESEVYVFDFFKTEDLGTTLGFLRWLAVDSSILKIIHNAKFEAKWFGHHLNVDINNVFCTYLASQLIAAGDRRIEHGLDDTALRYLNVVISKEQQQSDWSRFELTPEQLEYARRDAAILIPLHERLRYELKRRKLWRVAALEFAAVQPIAYMELQGFPLDKDAWTTLLTKKIEKRDILHQDLTNAMLPGVDWLTKVKRPKRPLKPKLKKKDPNYATVMADYAAAMEKWNAVPKEVPGLININSPIQIKKALGNLTGRDWFKLTTQDHVLALYADHFPIVAKLRDYREAEKSVTGYGENWLRALDDDGRIRVELRQIGAETGRMASGKPVNLQNVPNDAEHRACFKTQPGRTFIISDYSGIELRIAANFSHDAEMLQAFQKRLDLHRHGASLLYEVPYDEVTKEQRDIAKRINFLCVTPETKTLTEDFRWVEIGSLKVGDRLLAFDDMPTDHKQRRWRVSVVEHVGKAVAPVQSLLLADGTKLTGTLHHKVMVTGKKHDDPKPDQGGLRWGTIEHIQIGTHLAKILPFWEPDISYEGGWMTGFMDGEGHVRMRGDTKNACSFGLTQNEGPVLNRATQWLLDNQFDFGVSINQHGHDVCRRIYSRGGTQSVFRFLGMIRSERLLKNVLDKLDNCGRFEKQDRTQIIGKSEVFEAEIVELTTSTGTYLTDGYASHNTLYGGGARKLAGVAGVSLTAAQATIDKFFAVFSGLDTWLRCLAQQVQAYRFTRTASGRLVRYTEENKDSWYEQKKLLSALGRNGQNTPIQGTSADITKRALRLVYDAIKATGIPTALLVLVVHDEVVVECDEGDAAALVPIIEKAMIRAGEEFLIAVPVEVESKINNMWVK